MKKSNQKLALVAGGLAVAGVAGYMLMQNQSGNVEPTRYPLSFTFGNQRLNGKSLASSVTFEVQPWYYTLSKLQSVVVTAVGVRHPGIYTYTNTNGTWSWGTTGAPTIEAGSNFTIAVTALNEGNQSATISFKLTTTPAGGTATSTTRTATIGAGATGGTVFTVSMPAAALTVLIESTP